MLCHLCEPFLGDLVSQDFSNWRHVEPGWYTYKHGNYYAIKAAGEAGCEVCSLFDKLRADKIPGFRQLGDKWLTQASSIDYKYEYDLQQARKAGSKQPIEARAKWTFHLLTVLPEMSWIAFDLFKPSMPASPGRSNDSETTMASVVSPRPDDETAIEVAFSWLDQCTGSHSHCGRPVRTPLPTRVLEIQRLTDGSLNIRLQVNKGQVGRYVTLSHCWGSQGRLKLLKSNLAGFQRSIAFDALPRTFQDAIRLTASLGERYLWIDALCIVQNDKDDWQREAASMGSVFENALFSISALVAEDSHSGLLRERQQAQTLITTSGTNIGIRERLPSLDEALRASRLETRAWCLQERLLSPRILHVAAEQLYWECRTAVLSETSSDRPLKNDSGQASRPFTATGTRPVALERKGDDHHSHWLALIEGYSARNLTIASDRLPAIAGLADKAKKQLGLGTYMHGLWVDNLLNSLLWQRVVGRRSQKSDLNEHVSRPTWSWASFDNAICYPLINDAFTHQHTRRDLELRMGHSNDRAGSARLNTSTLSLIGLIKRGSCKGTTESAASGTTTFRASGSLLVDEGLPCVMDTPDESLSRGCYCLLVGAFKEKKIQTKRKGDREQRTGYLILERVHSTLDSRAASGEVFGTFRRIGMGFALTQQIDKVFANAERRMLDLA